jgi:uncharacterized protein YndB with AHSA1/START domain
MARDRIEKQAVLDAPQERVWQAISDAGKFGEWFGAEFDAGFEPGRELTGRIVPTRVDREVAKMQEKHTGMRFAFRVESVDPPNRIVFGWHPYAVDPGVDYSGEPMTRVTFALAEVGEGTRVTLTETGFDGLPASRREAAYAANDGGWTHQLKLLEKFVVTPY